MGSSIPTPDPPGIDVGNPPAGVTIGIEEEFHVLDPDTYCLVPNAPRRLAVAAADPELESELLSSTIESASAVCHGLEDLREEVVRQRRELCAAAERAGVLVATAGTVPASGAKVLPVSPGERYAWMAAEYGQLAAEQAICACHVHVGVPNRDLAVMVAMRVRTWLPVLLALSASSPFFSYGDTGCASYRTVIWSRWPTAGPLPRFTSIDDYDRHVDILIATGIITDVGMIYYDVRPSARYPTLEFRMADGCPAVDDAVLIAALSRGLVLAAEQDELAGTPLPDTPPTLLRAATWRAARWGTAGQLTDAVTGVSSPASELVDRLLAYVRPGLEDRGEWPVVKELIDANRQRGTSAERQRAAMRHGSWADVARALAAETANFS
jgi:carboxylate-amine ligase